MKVSARQLQRKLQAAPALPPDQLRSTELRPQLCGGTGIPANADSVACDSVQSLVAIGTSDGRVMVLGAAGVEVVMHTPRPSATQHLTFLPGHGALLRLTHEGELQVFSLDAQRVVASLPPPRGQSSSQRPTSLCPVPHSPHVFLGRCDGSLGAAVLLDAAGAPADPGTPCLDAAWAPWCLPAARLGGRGEVSVLAAAPWAPSAHPVLLLAHRDSGALVWDATASRALANAQPSARGEGIGSRVLSGCWAGGPPGSAWERVFCLGHDDGSVALWSCSSGSGDAATLLAALSLGRGAGPVRELRCLGASTPGSAPALLARAALRRDEPELLSTLPLADADLVARGEAEDVGARCRSLPWFGAILGHGVEGGARPAHASAVLVLAEGGQLLRQDLASWLPQPLTLPSQEFPPAEALLLLAPPAASGAHALCARSLRRAGAAVGRARGPPSGRRRPEDVGAWPLRGGEPPAREALDAFRGAGLLASAHRDGAVRLWDASRAAPLPLLCVPPTGAPCFLAGGDKEAGSARGGSDPAGARPGAVTALDACAESGLLAVGHAGGVLRLFQHSSTPQRVRRASVDENRQAYDAVEAQAAGLQLLLRAARGGAHAGADVSALCLASGLGVLLAGDSRGGVALWDLSAPRRVWAASLLDRSVAGLRVAGGLGCEVEEGVSGGDGGSWGGGIEKGEDNKIEALSSLSTLPTALSSRSSSQSAATPPSAAVVVAASSLGAVAVAGLQTGVLAAPVLAPKSGAPLVHLCLLDAFGAPLDAPAAPLDLAWADNSCRGGARAGGEQGGEREGAAARTPALSPAVAERLEVARVQESDAESSCGSEDSGDLDAHLRAALAQRHPGIQGHVAEVRRQGVEALGQGVEALGRGLVAGIGGIGRIVPGLDLRREAEGIKGDLAEEEEEEEKEEAEASESSASDASNPSPTAVSASARRAALPRAAYVLVATATHARLYSAAGLRAGERGAARKAAFDSPVAAAGVARACLVALSPAGALAAYALPSLARAQSSSALSAALEAQGGLGPGGRATLGREGSLVALTARGELLRARLFEGGAEPAGPARLVDWALERGRGQRAKEGRAASAPLGVAAPLVAAQGGWGGVDRVLDAVGRGAQGLAAEVVGGAGRLQDAFLQAGGRAVGVASPAAPLVREVPRQTLDQLLTRAPPGAGGSDAEDLEYLREDDGDAPAPAWAPRVPQEPRGGAGGAGGSARRAREYLVGGDSGGVRAKSAREIKKEYGRGSAASRTSSVADVMRENLDKLAARGEKLLGLDRQAAELQNEAQDFASMAKQLEEKMASRKWWQM